MHRVTIIAKFTSASTNDDPKVCLRQVEGLLRKELAYWNIANEDPNEDALFGLEIIGLETEPMECRKRSTGKSPIACEPVKS